MDMFVPKKGQGPILTPTGGLSDSDEERQSGSKVKRDGSPATPARSSASEYVNIPSAASAAAVSGASGVSAGSLGGADAAAARAMEDMQYVFSRLDEVQDGLADHLQRAGGPPGTSVQEGTSGAQTPRGPTTGNSEGEDGMFSTAMSVGEEPEKLFVPVQKPSKEQEGVGVDSVAEASSADAVRAPSSMATLETGRVGGEHPSQSPNKNLRPPRKFFEISVRYRTQCHLPQYADPRHNC